MKIQKHLTKKTKDICKDLAIECLKEVEDKFDTLKIIERYLLLLHKNLGVYKMTAFSELVHAFDRILNMAEEGNEFHLNIEGIYTKWEDDSFNDDIDNWRDSDYATIYVTVRHYEKDNKTVYDKTLRNVIELFCSCIDHNDYEEGDIELWREDIIEEDKFKVYETTFHYSFYSHEWTNQD